jgi:hypothetical protein
MNRIRNNNTFKRLQKIAEREIEDYKAGFRPNRSTIDHIHTLRQIMEKCYEYKIELSCS